MTATNPQTQKEEPVRSKKFLIEVNSQLHGQLKSQAALQGKSLKELTEEVVMRGLGIGTAAPEVVS